MTSTSFLPGAVLDHATPVRSAAQPLRNILRLNAATSLLGGLLAAAAAGPVAGLLGSGSVTGVRVVGVGLVVFAVGVAVASGSSIRRLIEVAPWISVADAVWVSASVVSIALGWFALPGVVVVGAVAAGVGAFCTAQLLLRRRLVRVASSAPESSLRETPPTEVVRASATIDANSETAWRVVTDHELFGRLAPNLARVRPTAADGPGLTRTCVNRSGDEWHETCNLWVEGRQFDVTVDTTRYPYPLSEMRGSWWTSGDSPTTIGMDYRYRPVTGARGRLFAIVMQAAFPFVLHRIIRGWRAAAGSAGDERNDVRAARRSSPAAISTER